MLLALCSAFSERAFAVRHAVLQKSHRRHFRWLHWHPMFRPSHESLLLQNAEIDRMNLPRIHNDAQLERLKASGDLVPIVPNETLRVQSSLDPARRYCRSWTLDFVNDISVAYFKE